MQEVAEVLYFGVESKEEEEARMERMESGIDSTATVTAKMQRIARWHGLISASPTAFPLCG